MPSLGSRHVPAVLALVAVGAATLPVGAHAAQARAAKNATVRIKDVMFNPGKVTVTRGGTVTWRFLDVVTGHTVSSRGHRRFHSSGFKIKGSYTVRFTRPGTYRYVCTIHSNMHGTVVVR